MMHEARAAELARQLELERARSAQLEDQLALSREQINEAYETVKPPINIDTGSNYSAGGNLALPPPPDPKPSQSAAVIAAVVGYALTLWILLRKK